MNVSPANISIPIMASSVNPATEQAERDNRVREQIAPTKEINATAAESTVNLKEKRQKKSSRESSEYPEYFKQPQRRRKHKAKKLNKQASNSKIAEHYQQSVNPNSAPNFDLSV